MMNKPLTITEKSIAKILSCRTGSGVFTKIVDLPDGERIFHKCGWAVGMHSTFISHQYEKHFGINLPEWVELQHPYHVIQLCKLALESKISLPEIYTFNLRRTSNE
jgi:hypothetical protein